MIEGPQDGASFQASLAQAAHHRTAMVERRNIGLRIVVGIVAFDLIVLKLALDAADSVSDPAELTWAIRLIATGAFVVLVGMLLQLEIRNRGDRGIYRAAERRAERIRQGRAAPEEEPVVESAWFTVRQSWATTWTLAGVFVLTIAIWWLAGLLADENPAGSNASPQRPTARVVPAEEGLQPASGVIGFAWSRAQG